MTKGFAITSKQCAPLMAVRCGHVAEVLRGLHRQLYGVDVGSMCPPIMLNGMGWESSLVAVDELAGADRSSCSPPSDLLTLQQFEEGQLAQPAQLALPEGQPGHCPQGPEMPTT